MGSADLMERNLDWRVEAAFPVYDPQLQQQVVLLYLLPILFEPLADFGLDDRFANFWNDNIHPRLFLPGGCKRRLDDSLLFKFVDSVRADCGAGGPAAADVKGFPTELMTQSRPQVVPGATVHSLFLHPEQFLNI